MSARLWRFDGLLPIGYRVVSQPCAHTLDHHLNECEVCQMNQDGGMELCVVGAQIMEREMEQEMR